MNKTKKREKQKYLNLLCFGTFDPVDPALDVLCEWTTNNITSNKYL